MANKSTEDKKRVHPPVVRVRHSIGTYIPGMQNPIVSDPRGSLSAIDARPTTGYNAVVFKPAAEKVPEKVARKAARKAA